MFKVTVWGNSSGGEFDGWPMIGPVCVMVDGDDSNNVNAYN
jgi:hypothetical protein